MQPMLLISTWVANLQADEASFIWTFVFLFYFLFFRLGWHHHSFPRGDWAYAHKVMKPLLYQCIQHPALLTSFEHNNIIKSYKITFDSQALCTICYLDYGPQMMGTPIAMVPLHVILVGILILIRPTHWVFTSDSKTISCTKVRFGVWDWCLQSSFKNFQAIPQIFHAPGTLHVAPWQLPAAFTWVHRRMVVLPWQC